MKNKNGYLILLAGVLLFAGCRYKLKDRPNWDTEVILPLAYSSLTLENLLTDSTLTQINSDQSVDIIYRDTLLDFQVEDYLEITDTKKLPDLAQ